MGTRSNTLVIGEYDVGYEGTKDAQILNMYRQMDGYPEGHGAELLAFLEPIEIVNGFTNSQIKQANGAGCLAAQMVAHFKVGVGGIYIEPPMVGVEFDNNFTYAVVVTDDVIKVVVYEWDDSIFSGTVPEFKKFIEGYTE